MSRKLKQPIKSKTETGELPPLRNRVLMGSGALLILVLRLLASQFPNDRLWGLNYFAFISQNAVIVACAVGILLATPLPYRLLARIGDLLFLKVTP